MNPPRGAWTVLFLAAGAAAQEPVLEAGKPLVRTLRGGETHSYRVTAAAPSQFLSIVADQRGVDLVLTVHAPGGQKLAEADGPDPRGDEPLSLILDQPAGYRIDVRSFEKGPGGEYEIRLVDFRPAAAADFTREQAKRLFADADKLRVTPRGESRRASIPVFEEARKLFGSVRDTAGESKAASHLALALNALGDNQRALEASRAALVGKRALGDRLGEATVLHNTGSIYFDLGDMPGALDHFSRALAVFRALGAKDGEGRELSHLGLVHSKMDEKERALEYYAEALVLRRQVKDRLGELATLQNLGGTYTNIGEYAKALDVYNQAAAVNATLKDRRWEAAIALMTGVTYERMDNYQASLEQFSRALELNRALGQLREEAMVLNSIGFTYHRIGDEALSLDHFEHALARFRQVGDKREEATALDNIGMAHSWLGHTQPAVDFLNQGLTLRRFQNDRRGQAASLYHLARLAEQRGNRREALDQCQQSLALDRAINERTGEMHGLHCAGRNQEALGDQASALASLGQSVALARDLGDRSGEMAALYSLAVLDRNRNNLTGARTSLERAIPLAEDIRASLVSQTLRTTYFASVEMIYRLYTEVLMRLGQTAPAFQAAERRRARSLIELLAEARAGIRQGTDAAVLAKESVVGQRLNGKERRRMELMAAKAKPERLAEADREMRALIAEMEAVRAQIRAKSPRFAALTQAEPVTVAGLQQQILDANTVLIEYALGDAQSHAWLLTQSSITGYTLPARAQIETLARAVHEWGSSPAAAPAPAALKQLATMILGPMAKQLRGQRLLIVADDALEIVPFAALPDPSTPDQPLAVDHEIVRLPSASTLALLRRDTAPRARTSPTVAILADPVFSATDSRVERERAAAQPANLPATRILQRAFTEAGLDGKNIPRLPGTRREAATIRALLPSAGNSIALDFDANAEAFQTPAVRQAGIVHLATHGLLNTVHPELSGLVLSLVDKQGAPKEGFLRLHDIYNLELSAGLVVLSACQTGLGQEVRGEGLLGLTRGFMYAGSPRVMASLWKVDDRATAELMRHFYEGLLGKPALTPAAALRRAQIALWKSKAWSAPYYWAAFNLQGEWK